MKKHRSTFVTDTWFLQELVDYLTPGRDEEIAYVTGPEFRQCRILSRISGVTLERQSIVYARATARSCSDTLLEMLDHGNRLHVMAHSHPGSGIHATCPSGIDLNYLGRIQRAGANVIGIIVTRDGYLRFFTVCRPFRLLIQGNNLNRIQKYVYRLDRTNHRHLPTYRFAGPAFHGY